MILHRFICCLLCVSLLSPVSFAHGAGIDKLNDFQDGKLGVNKSIARPISKFALKKMGTPGFMISKFMTYRKLMTTPLCTTSEKLSFVGNLLTLAGDITNHVITIKNGRELKKEFAGKTDQINEYLKDKKELLGAAKETGDKADVQLLAIDYSIKSNELELERLKMLRNFKNPALALFLASNIMNAKEALAEGASFGTYLAEVNACKTAGKPVQVAKEAAIETTSTVGMAASATESVASSTSETPASDKPAVETPWYIKPFMFIAGKLGIETKDQKDAQKQKEDEYGGIGPLTSANYAEEMIVGVVDGLQKEKKDMSKSDKIKAEAINIATRFLVKKAVKANIVAVDGFMRSSIGRTVVYGYNIWVIYTEFDQLKSDMDDTKTKIAALKAIRSDFTSTINTVKFQKEFEAVFAEVFSLLLNDAYAEQPELQAFGPIKMCLEESECSKVGEFLDKNLKKTLMAMPAAHRNDQITFLNNSYAFNEVRRFNKGLVSIQQIDQNRVDSEILKYEAEAERLADLLHKKNLVTKDKYLAFENQIVEKDYEWYAPTMVPNFNEVSLHASLAPVSLPLRPSASAVDPVSEELPVASEETKVVGTATDKDRIESELKEVMKTDFDYEDVHQNRDDSLWKIISKRYRARDLKVLD